MWRNRVVGCILLLIMAVVVRAESVEMLAHIHTEAIGGRARLAKLEALRARGQVVAGGQTLEFELLAQRPNRVRVTMRSGGRTLVQGFDGVSLPWRWVPGSGAEAVPMGEAEAREFAVDAEFDDPLASPPGRGYQLDFAGQIVWAGRPALRVLVTRRDDAPCYLVLDPDTYFIVARNNSPGPGSGRPAVETRFDDFRPVAGVIFPHRIDTYLNGRMTRQTILTSVQAIPAPPPETFAMPVQDAGTSG